jgi:hypothetical protein
MRAQIAALAVALVAVAGRPIVFGAGKSDADHAARAAVAATGGGEVVQAGRETENGATWEVEVARPDGRRVDVLLDARFGVMSVSDERDPAETSAGRSGGHRAHLAAQAAARAVGGGFLVDVDRVSQKGATWEIEFAKLDGKRVSVLVDDQLRVIGTRGKPAR